MINIVDQGYPDERSMLRGFRPDKDEDAESEAFVARRATQCGPTVKTAGQAGRFPIAIRCAYSAMSAAALLGRVAAPGFARGATDMSICGGGVSCSTSAVYTHSWYTFSGLSFSLVP